MGIGSRADGAATADDDDDDDDAEEGVGAAGGAIFCRLLLAAGCGSCEPTGSSLLRGSANVTRGSSADEFSTLTGVMSGAYNKCERRTLLQRAVRHYTLD